MQKTIIVLAELFAFAVAARAQTQDNSNAPVPIAPAAGNGGQQGNGQWKKDHPRRAEVNGRMNKGVQDGDMTKGQEAKDRREERRMAAKDGGHITKADQRKLNRRINRQEKRDAKKKAAAGQ